MTSVEMKKEFLVSYDKVANLASPGYEDDEISYFLTKAQENFTLSYINPDNKYGESIEETEKVKKYFSALISPSTDSLGVPLTTLSSDQSGRISTNSVIYNLPDNFWLSLAEWVVTNDTCNTTKNVDIITHNEYNKNKNNPFKRPNSNRVWRMDVNSIGDVLRHELITDGTYTITQYHVRYIKKLTPIVVDEETPANNVDCILHESAHRRIIDEAVKIALETSQEQRLQTFIQTNNK
jgi:hypothetical protein